MGQSGSSSWHPAAAGMAIIKSATSIAAIVSVRIVFVTVVSPPTDQVSASVP